MLNPSVRLILAATGLAAALFTGPASAAACTGISLGTSTTDDVTFAGAASDQCVISNVNPQQGPNGNTSGFSGAFGGGWSLLGKVTSGNGSNILDGVNFAWTFTQLTGTTGTWSLVTDVSATFDLVFAMHASNRSGAFLFDDLATFANQVGPGTYEINWVNFGGNVPNFSNLTFFARDVAVTPIPEPETYALFLAGLAAMSFVARRRRHPAQA